MAEHPISESDAFIGHLSHFECAENFTARAACAENAVRDVRLSFASRRVWYRVLAEATLHALAGNETRDDALRAEALASLRRGFLALSAPLRGRTR